MKIAVVHKHNLGKNFIMPEYLSAAGIKTVEQRILSGDTWAYRNHKDYAEHNGYIFINDQEPWYDNKPPDWAIWQAALRALKDPDLDVDWIFFSVNDIFYADMDYKLEEFLKDCPESCFLATGQYMAKIKWHIVNPKESHWEVKFHDAIDYPMISGWSHFIRKCPESIEFVTKLDNDMRLKNVEILNKNSFTGDIYLSIIFNGYPEYRKFWHIYSTKDQIRVPGGNKDIQNWIKEWNLEIQEEKPGPMVFSTCCISVEDTLKYQELYTKSASKKEEI